MSSESTAVPGAGGPQFPQFGPPQSGPQQSGPQQQLGPPQFGPQQQFGQAQPPQFPQQGYGPPMNYAPLPSSSWPLPRVAALAVVVSGLGALIASLFSLYSAEVTPSGWGFGGDAPGGSVSVGLGFYDTFPIQAPIIAVIIPVFMMFAALSALPMLLQGRNQKPVLPAFFALAATLVAIVLMISRPLPGVDVTGELGRELQNEVGTADINKLVDSVVPISPGIGLILALVFSVIGCAGALYIYALAERGSSPAAPLGFGPQGPAQNGTAQNGTVQPGMAQPGMAQPYGNPGPPQSWQPPAQQSR